MTQRIKSLAIILSVVCLVHCQGAGGKRIFGSGIQGQSADHSQVPNSLTQIPSDNSDVAAYLEMLDARQKAATEPSTSEPDVTPIDEDIKWKKLCEKFLEGKDIDGNGQPDDRDTDGDGLPDDCETFLYKQDSSKYFALDPNIYNGWIIGGRYFNGMDPKFQLDDDELIEWKKDQKSFGGLGDYPKSYQNVIKKLSVIKKRSSSDIAAFKEFFYNYSEERIRIDQNFKSYDRNELFEKQSPEDQNLAVATGDGDEALPHHIRDKGTSIGEMTAFGKDLDSRRIRHDFMITYEGNVAVPSNLDYLEVTVGYLSNKRSNLVIAPKSALYEININGEAQVLQTDIVTDHGKKFEGSKFGLLKRSAGCETGHVNIIALAPALKANQNTAIMAEGIFVRAPSDDPTKPNRWRKLNQGDVSIQPQGGATCMKTFDLADADDNKTFFKTANQVPRLVNQVINFNGAVNKGVWNVSNTIDKNSVSLVDVQKAFQIHPISTMTLSELKIAKQGLAQIDLNRLSKGELAWFNLQVEEVKKREEAIRNEFVKSKLNSLEGLINSADFEKNKAQIDALIAEFEKNIEYLNDEQKAELARLKALNKKKNDDLAAAAAAAAAKAAIPNAWSDDLLEYLTTLDGPDSKVQPGLTPLIKVWSITGFATPKESDDAKKIVADKITEKLVDPSDKTFTTEERNGVVDNMVKYGLIDDLKALELKGKIVGRDLFVGDDGKSYDSSKAKLFTMENHNGVNVFKFDTQISFKPGKADLDDNGSNLVTLFTNFMNRIESNEKYVKINAYTDATSELNAFQDANGKLQPVKDFANQNPKSKNMIVSRARAKSVEKDVLSKSKPAPTGISNEGKGVYPGHQGTYNARATRKTIGTGRKKRTIWTKKGWTEDKQARRVEIYFAPKEFRL